MLCPYRLRLRTVLGKLWFDWPRLYLRNCTAGCHLAEATRTAQVRSTAYPHATYADLDGYLTKRHQLGRLHRTEARVCVTTQQTSAS